MNLASPIADLRDGLLGCVAPEGSFRRAWLRGSKRLLETCLPKRKPGEVHFKPPVVCSPLDIYDVRVMKPFLRGLPLSVIDASPADAEDSVRGAARWLLVLLLDRPDLRQRFP